MLLRFRSGAGHQSAAAPFTLFRDLMIPPCTRGLSGRGAPNLNAGD